MNNFTIIFWNIVKTTLPVITNLVKILPQTTDKFRVCYVPHNSSDVLVQPPRMWMQFLFIYRIKK